MSVTRRDFLLATATLTVGAPAILRAQTGQHIVIIGGGFGGATAAKYLKKFNPSLKVTLIEPMDEFVMCPLSNRVLGGGLSLSEISRPYGPFVAKYGIRWVRAAADDIDADKREVRIGKDRIQYDRLIVAPGVDFEYDGIPGMESAEARHRIPHAWKAGPQTQRLRDMLTDMPDGGVMILHVPKVPYRCPPGPYERASLIANFLKLRKPKSKLFVYDSNPEIQAKKGLFESVWRSTYKGLIEYVPNAEIATVDAFGMTIDFKVHGKQKADVINVIPPQRAGAIARKAGLANVGDRWCGVDFLSYESTARPRIHVLGDSIAASPGMPKSGHMANQHAKVCAGAIGALTRDEPVPEEPIIANTCYSFVTSTESIHVASVYRYDRAKRTMVPAPGAGGLSPSPSKTEGMYAMSWASNILEDTLG